MANRYSQKEITIITNYIAKYPTNLTFAFEKASARIGRSAGAVGVYYYTHLRNSMNTHLTCGSRRGFSRNHKNNPRRVANSTPKQELHIFKDLWKHFRGLF